MSILADTGRSTGCSSTGYLAQCIRGNGSIIKPCYSMWSCGENAQAWTSSRRHAATTIN